jgi:hypothetical protein
MGQSGDRIHPPETLGSYIVRRNVGEFAEIQWRRSATRHRVSRHRSLYVVERAHWALELPRPDDDPRRDPRLLFLGEDRAGVVLEVIGVETGARVLALIHAMPLRKKYREAYEEVGRWEKWRRTSRWS